MDVKRAQEYYDLDLKEILEPDHTGRIVAIDASTGVYFLGDDLAEALDAALEEHPDRQFGALRVGGGGVVRVGSSRLPHQS